MNDDGVFETVGSYLWPAGPIMVCLASLAVLFVLRRRNASDRARRAFRVLAVLAGCVVAYQAIRYGRPTVGWMVVGGAAVWFAHARPDHSPIRRAIITALRNAMVSATAGVALVVAMQVVLAYQTKGHAERVLGWNRQIAAAYAWLEHVVFLGPIKLAVVLAASIAVVVTVTPALHMVRSYRRFANAATHALLALTVTTSFTFFTSRGAPGWQKEWIARQKDKIASQMGEIERQNQETVALIAIDDAVEASSPAERAQFRTLVRLVQRHPDHEAIWVHFTERWKRSSALAPIAERVRRAQAYLDTPPPTQQARDTAAALDRLQRVRTTPEDVGLADLDVLAVQRTKAAAVNAEVKQAIGVVAREALLGDSLPAQLLNSMVDAVTSKRKPVRRDVNVASVRTAMNAEPDGPPRVTFDPIDVPLTASENDIARAIHVRIADIGRAITVERELKVRESHEQMQAVVHKLRRQGERELAAFVPSVHVTPPVPSASRPPSGGCSSPTRRSKSSNGNSSPGRRGGGRFGGRRRDPNRPPPVRLVA